MGKRRKVGFRWLRCPQEGAQPCFCTPIQAAAAADLPEQEFLGSRWPEQLGTGWRDLSLDFQARAHAVALQLLQALAISLGRDEHVFDEVRSVLLPAWQLSWLPATAMHAFCPVLPPCRSRALLQAAVRDSR